MGSVIIVQLVSAWFNLCPLWIYMQFINNCVAWVLLSQDCDFYGTFNNGDGIAANGTEWQPGITYSGQGINTGEPKVP